MRVSSIEGCFDRSKVVSIGKSRFERRQGSVQSVSIELIYQICLKIFSFAVDKRTKNNLYMHRVSVFITTYSSIETFASIELIFGFNRMTSRDRSNLRSNWLDTKSATGSTDSIQQIRKIMSEQNLNSELHWYCQKEIMSLYLLYFHLNLTLSKIYTSWWFQFQEGTLWILFLLTLVVIHVLLMLLWKSLRICFFHIYQIYVLGLVALILSCIDIVRKR